MKKYTMITSYYFMIRVYVFFLFFFQAEDGIRDIGVTGVQTCALPILGGKRLYEFGPFRLDPAERVLTRGGQPVPLTPKAFDLLVVLVENGGHLLGKKDLMGAGWPDSFVEEGNLTFTISSLRKALGEDPKEPQYIENVPPSGYRFVADEIGRAQ